MSKFYQRYLSNLRKARNDEAEGLTKPADDPTAMVNKGSGPAGGPTRRGLIYNESFAPDSKKELVVHAKSDQSSEFLIGALMRHYLFESLGADDLERIIECMKPLKVKNGETIIKQGDVGDLFYCLEIGSANALVEGQGVVFTYQPGGCFGELALIYNSPRAASVAATSNCELWTLDLATFRQILASTSNSKSMRRCDFLKKCVFLDPLSNEQVTKLAGALEESTYADGDYIVKQGEVGDSFYIIESGSVKCTQIKSNGREVELITLNAEDYFGEMALMLNETRHANCIAVGAVTCYTLDRAKFNILLGSVQDLLARRMRIRILQSVPLLSKLPESKLARLSGVMRVQAFKPNQYIIKQGEEGSRFYIINEGEVRCTRSVSSTQEEELIKLYPQEFFGERALITNEPRKANVVAVGNVECLVLERTSFQSLLTEVHDDMKDVINTRNDIAPEAPSKVSAPVTDFKFEDLRIMRTIGTGTFGRVKLVQHQLSGRVCALKCMKKTEIVASHQEKNIMNEKNLLFECSSCPFVLALLQTYNQPSQIMMLMEFVQGGEMWSYIYEKANTVKRNTAGGFEMSVVKFYAANVLLAFRHLHKKNIAYRDLKPENLLLDSQGYVKMIDFGFAKKFPYTKNGTKMDKTYTLCGTPEYLAPEIVMSKGYDKCVDYWAYGCFVYELYLARTPFQAAYTTKIFQNIVASEKCLAFPARMDPQHVALIKKLLNPNPAFRLGNVSGGVDDILRDPFFSSIDWNGLGEKTVTAPYMPQVNDTLDASNFDTYEEEDVIPTYTGSQDAFVAF